MLDARLLRKDPDAARRGLTRRGMALTSLERWLELDGERKELATRTDDLKAQRNQISGELGKLKKAGGDISEQAARMRGLSEEIKQADARLGEIEVEQKGILESLPNLPADDVPDGKDAADNRVVRQWGEATTPAYPVKPHFDYGEELGILDFKRSARLSGSRFWLLKGFGARLERALISFMLDVHTGEHGYTEVMAPVLVTGQTMYGTGQLPKFEADLFKCQDTDLYLIPTSEVPITNVHAGEILDGGELPKYYCGFSPCFRSEAGAAGKDTRGLVRVHQFHKVEMIKLTHPETSFDELEKMVANAETILRRLEIPHRVVLLCTGDMGFSSAKTYDLEFWTPAQQRWVEVSSCSDCTDFQARRAQIRFRRAAGESTELVHTLNGSGLAVGRTMVAILENFQQPDGSLLIPAALRPYLGGMERYAGA
ncbi:MAG: serine--tRNA ligase [Candidatus Eremiobacterota bacterium]